MTSRKVCALVVMMLFLLPVSSYGCPVCYGAGGDPMNEAANKGILFLLVIVGLVQLGFVALFWSFWRRSKEKSRRSKQWQLIRGGLH